MSAASAFAFRRMNASLANFSPARTMSTPTLPAAATIDPCRQAVRLPDGRELAWYRYGDATGAPLYVMHGFPSCGALAALLHEQALARGISLIAPDRPGFGHSTPAPGRCIADWPRDIRALADQLGHTQFGVLGLSCGGPYALACAAALPERVMHVSLLGAVGPMHVPALRAGQLLPLRVLFGLARLHRWMAAPMLLADAKLFSARPEAALDALAGLLSEPDRRLLKSDNQVRQRFIASFVGAYRQGIGGAMTEATLIARPHGIDYAAIHLPVHVHQAGHDRHVPEVMGRHLAASLPRGVLHLHPDEGHLSVAVHGFGECAGQFLADWARSASPSQS